MSTLERSTHDLTVVPSLGSTALQCSRALALQLLLTAAACSPAATADDTTEASLMDAPGSSSESSVEPMREPALEPSTEEPSGSGLAGAATLEEVSSSTVQSNPNPAAAADSFQELYRTVFQASGCGYGYCHSSAAGGLQLSDAQSSLDALVGVEATIPGCGLTMRVVPFEPEASLLWLRVRPAQPGENEFCIGKMPKGGVETGLSAEKAQLVYDWIAGGALP